MTHSSMAGMFLTYRPPKKESEPILGYLYRALYAGGHVRMKDLATTLVDRQTIQPPWTVPSNLRRLCEELAPVFGSAEQIVARHTCLPAHLPFVAPVMRTALMAHVLDGKQHPGIAAVVGLTGRAAQSKPRMAMCLTCIHEDTLKHGFPFWRREHALAGLGYCPHHGTALVVGCGVCRFSQRGSRYPLMPRLDCWCGSPRAFSQPEVTREEGAVLTRVARYARELLEGKLDGATPADIGAHYHLCAHRAGYANGSRVKSPALVAALKSCYTPAVFTSLNAGLGSDRNWLCNSMGALLAPNVLGRNLLLFDFFGQCVPTPEVLRTARDHMLCALDKRSFAPRRQHGATQAEVEADRATILAYLGAHPGSSRTELLKALGRAVMRARKDDAQWYADVVPARKRGRETASEEERAQYWRSFDERTAAHVLARRQELLAFEGSFPKAITKAALLKGAPRCNQVSWELLKRLPKTAQVIASSVESSIGFKMRYAMAILQQPQENGQDRVMDAHLRTGLALFEIDRLNFTLTARTG